MNPADQFGAEVASSAGSLPNFQSISPIVEYLLQMLSGGQQPQTKAYTTSQQVAPQYAGPRMNPNALKSQMMQRPQAQETY